ncbi:MAG: hypothetical protein A3G35_20425 [candidate division NC10 bacterium RIFCSPLOWO2_12_FULL_66_18]|nr:MAG: hypothetical protein A3H39_10820 [candidate division NC10 bacterium RIFCSPLOWO2_02_FULL_66_22]OGB96336.1 MAG: hypothetical protein A3G35_20425 [candidate division NC10 bacterium RIFCSPLOWO2_12_FULL_66_18]
MMLEVRDLEVWYGESQAVRGGGGVSFQVAKGDLVAIIGANGAGNSSSLRALMGLEAFALFPLLAQRRAQPGRTLSGGEQQMLAIAHALMARPRLLLLDKVSLGLMPSMVAQTFATIRDLHRQGVTILLVEQNTRMALGVATRAYVLETAAIALQGTAAELAANPQVRRAYLGG